MAESNIVSLPRNEGETLGVYFQSTKCDMESKTSKSGKSYKNYLYEVMVAGEETISILPVYEKSQDFLDQLARFKPTPDDLCVISVKMVTSKSGQQFGSPQLSIPSKGLGGDKQSAGYQGETREERALRNEKTAAGWALKLVYQQHPAYFAHLDNDSATEEDRTKALGHIMREANKLLTLQDRLVESRLKKLSNTQQHEAQRQGSTGSEG